MKGLKVKENLQEDRLHIIQFTTGEELINFPMMDLSFFFKWLKAYEGNPNYISVPMKEHYCEMIYILKPQSLIVIEPETVYDTLNMLFGRDAYAYMEETAATFFSSEREGMSWDMPSFLKLFYSVKTRREALNIYNEWQEVIPLNESSFCKVLELMEYYIDEILNYFSLQEALDKQITPVSPI